MNENDLGAFREELELEEKSRSTVEKYLRDAAAFCRFAAGRPLTKALVLAYKAALLDAGYAPRSVNAMLAGINRLIEHLHHPDCRVKTVKLQRQIFCPAERELSRAEYERLLAAVMVFGMLPTVSYAVSELPEPQQNTGAVTETDTPAESEKPAETDTPADPGAAPDPDANTNSDARADAGADARADAAAVARTDSAACAVARTDAQAAEPEDRRREPADAVAGAERAVGRRRGGRVCGADSEKKGNSMKTP